MIPSGMNYPSHYLAHHVSTCIIRQTDNQSRIYPLQQVFFVLH